MITAVALTAHNLWQSTNEDLVVRFSLTFRSLQQLTDELSAAGLTVTKVGEPAVGVRLRHAYRVHVSLAR